MRRNIFIIGLVLLSIAGLTLWLDYQMPGFSYVANPTEQTLKPEAAPGFVFKTLSGEKLLSSDLKGKIILLHFWATWCPPCVSEFPKLLQAGETFRDDLVVIALSSDKSEADIEKFLKSNSLKADDSNIYMSLDKNRVITHDLFQTFAYPETIIIDRQGSMVRKIAGDADWTSKEMMDYLRSLAGKK